MFMESQGKMRKIESNPIRNIKTPTYYSFLSHRVIFIDNVFLLGFKYTLHSLCYLWLTQYFINEKNGLHRRTRVSQVIPLNLLSNCFFQRSTTINPILLIFVVLLQNFFLSLC